MKQKYDSSVVFLYAINKEHLLPVDFRRQIPYSTISTWRKSNYSNYLGHEFRYFFDQAFDNLELKFHYTRTRKMLYAVARAWSQIHPFFVPLVKKASHDKLLQGRVIRSIQLLKAEIGLEKALKIFGLSRTRYHQWILETRFDCFDSYSSICAKRHPHQLEVNEIKKMKKMLTEQEHDHWPIMSIAALALRQDSLTASLYSWYKYARLLNITKKPLKKQLKREGLIANFPNEYLHVDCTEYELIDGKKIHIAFVMDNFSKMILGYHVAHGISFEIVKKAIKNALKTIMTHPDQKNYLPEGADAPVPHSFLVADGGRENHNRKIDEFIAKLSGRKITKIRALKDIRFSNSPVEAVHKIMKSRYLRRNKFATLEAVNKFLVWAVHDYNYVRPHYKHKPKTPHEAYCNIPLNFDIRTRMKAGMKRRVVNNKNVKCLQCKSYREKKECLSECKFD